MAAIFSSTMMLLVAAVSRIPRTHTMDSRITIAKAGQLKPKCQPGGYSVLPAKSVSPLGRYAGVIHRRLGCQPNQSNRSTTCAENPPLTAMFETAYSRIKSHPIIHAINSPIVAYVYVYALPAMGIMAA